MATELVKLYGHLKAAERLPLVIAAMARGDRAEVERLTGACPIVTVRCGDPAYNDRHDALFDLAAVVSVDLKGRLGKLHLLRSLRGNLGGLLAVHQGLSVLAFMDGWAFGRGEPSDGSLAGFCADAAAGRGAAEPEAAGPRGDAADESDGGGAGAEEGEELTRRLDAVEETARRLNRRVDGMLEEIGSVFAREAAEMFEAWDRFCRARVGVDGLTAFGAWNFPTRAEDVRTLREYPGAEPRGPEVAEYEAALLARWRRLVPCDGALTGEARG